MMVVNFLVSRDLCAAREDLANKFPVHFYTILSFLVHKLLVFSFFQMTVRGLVGVYQYLYGSW